MPGTFSPILVANRPVIKKFGTFLYPQQGFPFETWRSATGTSGVRAHQFLAPSEQYTFSSVYANNPELKT